MKITLSSLFDTIDASKCSVTIVDNGSGQQTIDLLLSYRKQISNLVLLPENKGKPYAWNLGVAISKEKCKVLKTENSEYYLFCDNDLKFKSDWIDTLKKSYDEHKDLPLCSLSACRWPTHSLDLKRGETTEINITRFPMGCCIFMSAESFESNGNWDTGRLIRTVDSSYFRNSRNRGFFNASIHPNSVIEHTGLNQRSWHIQTGKPKLFE
ncbi:MAG: glycosyltransferase, partial [Nitrosopumilus sp.]